MVGESPSTWGQYSPEVHTNRWRSKGLSMCLLLLDNDRVAGADLGCLAHLVVHVRGHLHGLVETGIAKLVELEDLRRYLGALPVSVALTRIHTHFHGALEYSRKGQPAWQSSGLRRFRRPADRRTSGGGGSGWAGHLSPPQWPGAGSCCSCWPWGCSRRR